MQRKFCWPLAFAAIGLIAQAPIASRAQDQGGPLPLPVELDLQNSGPDDQLIKLAHAAKINIMADASDWPDAKTTAAAAPLTVAKKQPLIDWLRDMAYLNRLTWQRNASNTVVVWSEPDVAAVARHVFADALAERPQVKAEAQTALRAIIDPAVVKQLDADPASWSRALDKYDLYSVVVNDSLRTLLKEKYGWDGQDANFRVQIADNAIPAPLRSQIVLSRRIAQTQPDQIAPFAWLSDETWQKARLTVQQGGRSTINGVEQPRPWALQVVAPIAGRDSRQGVAALVENEGGGQ